MHPGRWTHLAAGGTSVIASDSTRLHRVVVGADAAGQTLALHDCAAGGDAAAGNLIATIELDVRGSYDFGCVYCAVGLVAIVSGGTPDITVVAG